ncbi:MAG: T9SS type A sorting domain-containing protein [Bacteroidetes bacterium]|nr:MAG: T9SS type A sorting domain-containing protein [Bacteroidota bacterium]
MKNTTTLLSLSVLILGAYSFTKLGVSDNIVKKAYKGSHLEARNSGGAIAGKTGAPGEGNCTDCHVGTANTNSQLNQLVMTVKGTTDVVTEYEPGQTYTLGLAISGTSTKKGFQATARTVSDNLTAGDLAAVTGSTARITQAQKQFINHASGTTSLSNFAFDWTAPDAGAGDVRFYVSSNHTNGDGNTSGDEIHLSQFTFSENTSSASIAEAQAWEFSVYPNPTSDELILKGEELTQYDEVMILDLSGKVVLKSLLSGKKQDLIRLSELADGTYHLRISGKTMADVVKTIQVRH